MDINSASLCLAFGGIVGVGFSFFGLLLAGFVSSVYNAFNY